MRRLIDVVVALVAALLVAPVLAVIAMVIMIHMRRPVLYRQERAGLNGRVFRLIKFRTMRPPCFHGEGDGPRTSAFGRFLRSSSLDELPQLWNIVRGEMSLIGPRPALPLQVEHYSPHQRGRLVVLPGLSGWAQVNGRNSITWPQRIELDLWYIAHRSLALDMQILLRTAARVLKPSGVRGEDGINPGFPTASGVVIDFWGAHPADPAAPTGPDVSRPQGAASVPPEQERRRSEV